MNNNNLSFIIIIIIDLLYNSAAKAICFSALIIINRHLRFYIMLHLSILHFN